MKLEKIIINGVEYYQWVIIDNIRGLNTVGDIFTSWTDIPNEKMKLKLSTR